MALKTVGKQVLSKGGPIVGDVSAGENFKQLARKQGKAAVVNLTGKAVEKLQQGCSVGVRPKPATRTPKSIKWTAKHRKKAKTTDIFGAYNG